MTANKATIDSMANEMTNKFVVELQEQLAKQVAADVAQKLAQVDVKKMIQFFVERKLNDFLREMTFPDGSISGSAIDLSKFLLSGNNVVGGIIKQFGSTGLQDNATTCQVTILDAATVIENQLITPTATIKGDLTVEGDLKLLGEIPTDSPFYKDLVEHSAGLLRLSMDGEFFLKYADKVFDQVKQNGLDLTKITLNGKELMSGNTLANFVTETNVQKVGELRSLTVIGETSLNRGTLTVLNGRVGINTTEPSGALSIWDEECELVARKLRKEVSIFGSTRNQAVILSSAGKSNLTLMPDGSVAIEKLTLGGVSISSATSVPKYEAKRGTLVFNETPAIGQGIGWVNIGGANWSVISICQ